MQYRKFGKLSFRPSALGLGCMRLPVDASGKIDEAKATALVRRAIDGGVNYVDTAYGYHGGESEILTGKALKNGYREKTMLATKSPVWLVKAPGDFERLLDEQLKKLATDRIDFYLLHALNLGHWERLAKLDIMKSMERARAAGKILSLGFSFHDVYSTFETILNGSDAWDFCQVQYNYMDVENQAGTKGVKLAASKGVGVVVMEPILGGRLARLPSDVQAEFAKDRMNDAPARLALDWLWNQAEVGCVLSGMTTMDQLEENLEAADASGVGKLDPARLGAYDRARARFAAKMPIPCTRCGYCMPCPNGINISWNFELYNDGTIYDDMAGSRFAYTTFMSDEARASKCIQCAECEAKCPQKIEISARMPEVAAVLERKD